MNKRNTATIRTLLIVAYTDILTKARKSAKGLRLHHLFSIQLLGDYPDGLGVTDAGRLADRSPQDVYNKFMRMIKAGFVYRSNKKYYLTHTGRAVYDTICKEFDVSFKKIVRALVEEANR